MSGLQKNSQTLSKKSLKQQVYAAFSNEDTNRVILSSVHKAKGREADRVFLLFPHLMPAEYARTKEAIRGEACIQFVALTRAKRDLIFVEESKSLAESILDDWVSNSKGSSCQPA